MFNPGRSINPDLYLKANAEILFVTILISLIITKLFNPAVLSANGIRDMVGYNNPCVYWDDPPAVYFAAFLFTSTVYFAIRYAVLDTQRARMSKTLPEQWKKAILVGNFWYATSQAINMLIFVAKPVRTDPFSLKLHSSFFLQLVPTLGLCMALRFLESWAAGDPVSKTQWAVLAISSFLTFLETFMASIAVFGYKGDKVPLISPWVMWMVDYAWFFSLPIVALFVPDSQSIHIHISLDETPKAEESSSRDAESQALQ